MANPALTVKVQGDTTGLDGSLKSATTTITAFGHALPVTRIEKVVAAGQKLIQFTRDLTQQGKEAQQSEAKFQSALESRGLVYADVAAATDEAILSAQKMGFTDDEARDTIIALTTATGSLDEALKHLPGAMDVARGSGKNLDTVTKAIASTLANDLDRGLGSIVQGLDHTGDAMDTLNQAYALNAEQAAAWATTQAGQADIAKIAVSEAAETIGSSLSTAFAGITEALVPLLAELGKLMGEILPVLTPLIVGLADALAKVLGWITDILSKAIDFIQFLKDIIADLGSIGDKLPNILRDFKLINTEKEGLIGDIVNGGLIDINRNRSSAATGGGGPAAAGTSAGSPRTNAGMVINIFGDPSVIEAKVTNAIRNYNRRNGAGAIFAPGRS